MMMKSLKFWRNWFRSEEPAAAHPNQIPEDTPVRSKPPSAITVRAAMRQKQKLAKASG